jgi:hypothetical protein
VTYLIALSAMILIGFALLGLIVGLWQALHLAPYTLAYPIRHSVLDGLALGSIVVALYWLCAIAYGLSAT